MCYTYAVRRCEWCRSELSAYARRDTKTCSTRCRVALHRSRRQPPAELRQQRRWVRRSARKVPLTTTGQAASSTNPHTWNTYRAVSRSTVGAGIGFVLNGDGIVCLDLDGCIDSSGRIAQWAKDVLDRCPATWIELSVSGTGLHVWGRGRVGVGRRIRDGERKVEVYGRGRYIALGEPWPGSPPVLGDLSEVLAWLS